MAKKIRRTWLGLALAAILLSGAACDNSTPADQTQPAETNEATTPAETAASPVTEPVTEETEETTETTAAESETTAEQSTGEEMTQAVSESETMAESTSETSDESPAVQAPEYVNPLTGLEADSDLSADRPAAIMINNIKISCPQMGVSQADIIYECLVEGGYTRLMMLVQNYEDLPEVGSVRSSRDYYLDFAADYDAIYVHAGGSPYAYTAIKERSVTNLDGVNMYLPTTFYRNQERIVSMGLEHSLMTTGTKIVEGIQYKRYRTDMTEDFDYPLDFQYGESLVFEEEAKNIHIPYSIAQITDFQYDEENGNYLRYQFNGVPHVDGATGEQLSFENVLIYFCDTGLITGDPSLRIEVDTVGEGSGYYATNGTYIPITWKKESHESPICFYGEDGELLLLNPGKTFVSVCPSNIKDTISFNYTK